MVPADLRLGLAFWVPIYYGIFVWLLSDGEPRGGARRRARGRHFGVLAPLGVGSLVPATARRQVAAAVVRKST